MASIMRRGGGLALALIILIVVSSSSDTITIATARSPYNRVRQLATDCNSPFQGAIAGCGRGGGSSGRPSGPAPGSSRCQKGCCGTNKLGDCICCK